MADTNHDELDRLLDAALRKYAAAAPRPRLEERVLANLRAERARAPDRAWWQWRLAWVVGAMVVIAVALTWGSGKFHRRVTATDPPATVSGAQQPKTGASLEPEANVAHAPGVRPTIKRVVQHESATTVAGDEPKLDRFPSPMAMSEQEIALAKYVRAFPQEATLVARAQADYEREIQQSMKDATSEAMLSDSEQQER